MLRLNVPFLLCSLVILNVSHTTFASNSFDEEISDVNLGVNVGDKFTYVLNKFDYSDSDRGLRISPAMWDIPIYLKENQKLFLEIARIEMQDPSSSGVYVVLYYSHQQNMLRETVVFPDNSYNVNSLFLLPTDWENIIPYYQNENSAKHYYEIEEEDMVIRIDYHYLAEETVYISHTNVTSASVYSIDISSVFCKNSGVLLQRHYSLFKNYPDTIEREYLLRQLDYYDSMEIRVPSSIIVLVMTLMISTMLIMIRK